MFIALLKTTVIALLVVNNALAAEQLPANDEVNAQQRQLYLAAKQAMKKNDVRQYQQLKAQLTHYPLYPYLEYSEISKKLSTYVAKYKHNKRHSKSEYQALSQNIDDFLSRQDNTYLGSRLLSKWLTHLAATKNWRDYKRYYQPYVKKTTLACFNIEATIHHRAPFPNKAIEALWLNKKSQPDACNPIFQQWERKGYLTQDLLWQRHKLAVDSKNYNLASYLHRKMKPSTQYLASLYTRIHKHPARIKGAKELSSPLSKADSATRKKLKDITYNGLYRYAYSEPVASIALLNKLNASYGFSTDELATLKNRIASRLLSKKHINEAIDVLNTIPTEQQNSNIEKLLRVFLAQQQWANIANWIDKLPSEEAASDRWKYWKARALEELQKTKQTTQYADTINTLYRDLSGSRSFYGFLSADKLNTQYQLVDKPAPIDLDTIKKIRLSPGMQRAKELFLLNEMHLARTEWRYSIRGFNREEHVASGQLAHLWGWNRKAIESMAKASYWDDLTIRFPIVHDDIIHNKAKKNNIPTSLVFSIARQESAWEFDAQSRVGARGLMQIMPATAKQTAQRAKLPYAKHKLFDPEYNITLGSHYISGLLKRHNNNRALAIASYNAGPHRVKQWLARTEASLPIDAWIEVIPFKETRKYVQNVLSYEVIYNYRQGKTSNLLTLAEANTAL